MLKASLDHDEIHESLGFIFFQPPVHIHEFSGFQHRFCSIFCSPFQGKRTTGTLNSQNSVYSWVRKKLLENGNHLWFWMSLWLIFFGFPITTSTLLVSPSSLPFGSKISKHGDKNCTGNQQLGTCSVNFKCWCISVLAKNSNETNNNNNNNNNKMFNANHLPLTLFQNRNIYSIVQCSWLLAPCGDFWLRYHLETIWLIHLMYFWQIFSLIPSLLRNYDRWASATDIIC